MRRASRTSLPAQQTAASAQQTAANIALSRWLISSPVIPSASSGQRRASRVSTSVIPQITSGRKIIARLSPSAARVYSPASR